MNPSSHSLSAFRHSVRSDLNQIIGYAELLSQEQRAGLPEACLIALEDVQSSARRFLQAFALRLGSLPSPDYAPQLLQDPALSEPLGVIGMRLSELLGVLPVEALGDLRQMQQAHLSLKSSLSNPLPAPKGGNQLSSAYTAIGGGSYSALVPREGALRGRILVIDDSQANRELLQRQLKEIGLESVLVADGAAGLQELAAGSFDCVLLDMVIPVMDGPAVLRAIRANPDWVGIPVLMLSALEELLEAAHCIEIGAEDYLLRPIELPLLRAKLFSSISRKLLYEDCQQLGKDLGKANEDLKRFLMVASHDLQAPLRTLQSELTQLSATNNVDESLQLCRRMNTLVQDLLIYARMGQAPPYFEDVSLEWVVSEAISNLSAAIQEAGAEVKVEALPAVRADFKQMLHLFQNLLGNAIRYRSDETPRISVVAHDRETHWLIGVSDNGCGIPEDQREKIFNPFHRLHGDDVPGTGLGLAIAQRAVEQSHGRIWVDSIPGQGSTFWVLLPKP
jgi:two-component system, sensor histidine kinase and response regulator